MNSGRLLARNATFTFLVQLLVGIISLVAIPILVEKLGEEKFGILTIIWMIIGYFSVLDLGIGQASVKYIAAQLAKNDRDSVNVTFWGSFMLSFILGAVVSLVVVVIIFFVKIIHPNEIFSPEQSFQLMLWIGLAVFTIIVQSALRSLLTAKQRLDIVNIVLGINGLFQWAGAIVILNFSGGIFEIVIFTVLIRILSSIAFFAINITLFPFLSFPSFKSMYSIALQLLRYGAWINLSQIISPVVKYLDRVLVASYFSMKTFTFYVIPYEAVSRLQIIPSSISTALFPAIAQKDFSIDNNNSNTKILYLKSINYIILIMLPVTITIAVFSKEIMNVWLGENISLNSNWILKILAIATFIQAIGYIPLTTLQAIGKAEIAAKFYIIEIPIYIILCFFLIPKWGIEGAAWAFLIRLLIIVGALLYVTHIEMRQSTPEGSSKIIIVSVFINIMLLIACILISAVNFDIQIKLALLFFCCIGYLFAAWNFCVGSNEKQILINLLNKEKVNL